MNLNYFHYKFSAPNVNKITKDINLLPKENSFNTFYNLNNNKNMKINNLPHSLSLNKNVQLQPPNNFLTKLIQPDKLKKFIIFTKKKIPKN